ncbi:anti-sigma factor [Streptomyces sp. cg36]|uniref:anti-sigma factor n=1 Tax=Streptomyces sp. cg36 TaxID=3238798 RepID=UPI0034E2653C
MKRLAPLFAGAAGLGAGSYVVIYLYRWQWQRAIMCGVLLLVAEILLLGLVLLGRLSRIEERIGESDRRHADVLARLEGLREQDDPATRFRWLDDVRVERTHVFVPVLMAAGAVLSGLARVVQKIAQSTVRPAADRRTAGRLAVLAAPPLGADLDDLPPGGRDPRRTRHRVTSFVAGTTALAALVLGLGELTETRPEDRAPDTVATSVVVRLATRGASGPDYEALLAHEIWDRCRHSTSAPLTDAALGALGDRLYAGVVRPALTDHDRMRLRGCLEDTATDHAYFEVVGMDQTRRDRH